MILLQDKRPESQEGDLEHEALLASGSGDIELPPPPFEDEPSGSNQQLLNLQENADEPPPPGFAPYEADYFEAGMGDIVSHDPHLNSDGEALYRFLLAQDDQRPCYRLHCRGTHSEHRTRWVSISSSNDNDGRTQSRRETYTETVTDFDFYIDAAPHKTTKPVHWSVADNEPTYRGSMVREVENLGDRQKVRRAERKAYERWLEERTARGLPPWISSMEDWREGMAEDSIRALKSSKTLRQWADEYCASPKYLKEFVYTKVLYGWNLQQLESAIRSSISGTMYHGHLEVSFRTRGSKIYIRPDNKLSRMLSNKWLKFLSIIFLIFPFIWLFKRFNSRGGGRWEICGGGYALKRWVPAGEVREEEENYLSYAHPSTAASRMMRTQSGDFRLVGLREGEWFRKWEGTILRAVRGHYQSPTPIYDSSVHISESTFLDGY